MPKVDKLALVRLALRQTFHELDKKEKLCVLADMYAGNKDAEAPRWWGQGGGPSGLEQGIYNSMITFRRVSNLWSKILVLSPDVKQETRTLRDALIEMLEKGHEGISTQIYEKTEEMSA